MPIYQLTLEHREEVADNTVVLTFKKPEGFTFKPGQYGGFTLINPIEKDAGGITRRFSLLTTPDDTYIAIATRFQPSTPALHSAYKRELLSLAIGSPIKFAGPTGTFTLHEDPSIPAVFIAGGIGIAPFYSMICDAVNRASTQPLYLFYGNQTLQDVAFLKEFTLIKKQHAAFTFVPTLAQPPENWQGETGFITHTMIKKYLNDINLPFYYICGSPVMVTTLQEMLAEMGIDEDRIRVEDFPGY